DADAQMKGDDASSVVALPCTFGGRFSGRHYPTGCLFRGAAELKFCLTPKGLSCVDSRKVIQCLQDDESGQFTCQRPHLAYAKAFPRYEHLAMTAADGESVRIPVMNLPDLLQAKIDACPLYSAMLREAMAAQQDRLTLVFYCDEVSGHVDITSMDPGIQIQGVKYVQNQFVQLTETHAVQVHGAWHCRDKFYLQVKVFQAALHTDVGRTAWIAANESMKLVECPVCGADAIFCCSKCRIPTCAKCAFANAGCQCNILMHDCIAPGHDASSGITDDASTLEQVQSVESSYDLGHFPTPEEHWASQNPIDPADISRPVQLYQADWSEVTHADITAVINYCRSQLAPGGIEEYWQVAINNGCFGLVCESNFGAPALACFLRGSPAQGDNAGPPKRNKDEPCRYTGGCVKFPANLYAWTQFVAAAIASQCDYITGDGNLFAQRAFKDKERPKYLLGIDLGLSSSDTDWRSPLLAMLKPRATRNYRRPAAPREQEESRYRERSQSRPDPKGKGRTALVVVPPLPNRQAPCRLEQAPARRWRRPLPPPGRQDWGYGQHGSWSGCSKYIRTRAERFTDWAHEFLLGPVDEGVIRGSIAARARRVRRAPVRARARRARGARGCWEGLFSTSRSQ
ncbi:unnamed protein product, partial [Cladocopium goreaui]